jgi:methyl-galactoside transport system ATP-binding protein
MDEIFKISDDIAILRDGKLVVQDEVSKFDMNKIIKLMVGRSLENRFPEKINNVGKTLFECESISSKYDDDIKDIKFDLKEGEILGIAGLVGSGRTEVLELIFGLRTSTKDTSLKIDGVSISNTNPKNAMKNGFALVTEERRATGIFKVLSVYDNTVMANLGNYSKYGFLKTKNSLNESLSIISSLRVKTPSYKTRISSLSGGNQQKVIIGRWLLTNPKVLLLDEPTRGIDVLAKYEIYQFMIEIAKENKGVIMVSSEMPELLGITDRILVMSNKRVAGILETKNTNQEEIMHLAEKYM